MNLVLRFLRDPRSHNNAAITIRLYGDTYMYDLFFFVYDISYSLVDCYGAR